MKKFFISLLFCLGCTFALQASEFPQDATITITGQQITLQAFISQVESQTQYLFVYSKTDVDVNQVLPIKEGRKTVAQCLNEAFSGKDLTYVFENNYIVLTYKAPEFLSISGKVVDADTKRPLIFASVSIDGKGIGNVTNGEGNFLLKFPVDCENGTVRFSFLGYTPAEYPIKVLLQHKKGYEVDLHAVALPIPALLVKPLDPVEIIDNVIAAIPQNYPAEPMQMTAFYREMIRKGSSYVTLTEAVLDVYKTAYNRLYSIDQVGVYKGRGSVDYSRIDTIFVKFRGGINSALEIDVAKFPFLGTNANEVHQYYDFRMEHPVQIDNRVNHVISFDQKPNVRDIYFRGKLYIDTESLAITRVEFNMNVEGRSDASNIFLSRHPIGFRVEVLYATYVVQYKKFDDKWTFDYSRTELKFNSKWDRKLFKSIYTIESELAVTDRSKDLMKIPSEQRVRFADIAMDKVTDFQDEGFWEDYNVIEPESGIEQVIARITRQLKRRR